MLILTYLLFHRCGHNSFQSYNTRPHLEFHTRHKDDEINSPHAHPDRSLRCQAHVQRKNVPNDYPSELSLNHSARFHNNPTIWQTNEEIENEC